MIQHRALYFHLLRVRLHRTASPYWRQGNHPQNVQSWVGNGGFLWFRKASLTNTRHLTTNWSSMPSRDRYILRLHPSVCFPPRETVDTSLQSSLRSGLQLYTDLCYELMLSFLFCRLMQSPQTSCLGRYLWQRHPSLFHHERGPRIDLVLERRSSLLSDPAL